MVQIDLQPQQVRPLQIIHAALAMGIFVFLMVTVLIPGTTFGPAPGGEELMTVLSIVHVLAFFTALGIGRFMFDSQMQPEKLEALVRGVQPDTGKELVLAMVRRVYILRLALLEGAAFFGLAVVLIAKMSGILESAPVFWLNALSAVFFIGFVAWTFPSREKLADLLR